MTASILWYREPARRWVEALPIGNGRLGAMVFGGVPSERWQLNEDSLWTGGPEDADNPEALAALPEIRRLLLLGRYAEAQQLTDATQIRKPSTRGGFGSYTTLGELRLDPLPDADSHDARQYRRQLDLSTGIATTRYRRGSALHVRESFASHPDQVLVLRLTSSEPDLHVRLALARPGARTQSSPDGSLAMSGRLAQRDLDDGMRYATRVRVSCEGGGLAASSGALEVRGARALSILLAAGTDYRGADFEERIERQLAAALRHDYATLRSRHVADHQPRMARVALKLPAGPASEAPTNERLLADARGAADPSLAALYFQLGRYLLCASSRPGALAANLQGIWAEGLVNPWNGDYHTNINVQMSYWLAETGNLADCAEPLFELIERMRQPGRHTANVHYGARGWVVHTIHNVWGFTAPGEKPLWGLFPMAGPWLCQHLWEHYAFGGDLDALRRSFHCLREAAEFCLDWLVRHPITGKLVSGPASSPENTFVAPSGDCCSISMGPSMDQQILWDHFGNLLEAARALGIDDELTRRVAAARDELAPPSVGPDGRLLEWAEAFAEVEPQHRHVSHLFGLHPGRQITITTPEWYAAARCSLDARGDGGTGWSRAWKICFWARLGDGRRAHHLLSRLLTPVGLDGTEFAEDGAGVYPNLFCAHPPFQIDGNLGAAAGIAEMLLQSHDGELHLLPALPPAWPSGSVRGLRARGGVEVSMRWNECRLQWARLSSRCEGTRRVRYADRVIEREMAAGDVYDLLPAAFER